MSRLVTTSETFRTMEKRRTAQRNGEVLPPATVHQNIRIMRVPQLARSIDILGPRYKYRKQFLRPRIEIPQWVPQNVEEVQREIDKFAKLDPSKQDDDSNLHTKFVNALKKSREKDAKPI